jgi:hypothetical protein
MTVKYLISYTIILKNVKIDTDDDLSVIIGNYDIISIIEIILKNIADSVHIDILHINHENAIVDCSSDDYIKSDINVYLISKDSYIQINYIEKYEEIFEFPKEPFIENESNF